MYGSVWAAPDLDEPVVWVGEVASGPFERWQVAIPSRLAEDVVGALGRVVSELGGNASPETNSSTEE